MNEQAIQDAYNLFKIGGYSKSIDEFKTLIATNPNALNDSYTMFKTGGYSKSIDEYKTLMGVNPVKKKGKSTVLPTKVGSLGSEKPTKPISPTSQPKLAPPIYQQQEGDFSYGDIQPKPLELRPFIKDKPIVSAEPTLTKKQILDNKIKSIKPELVGKEEEFVVPELNYKFKEQGFKFEEKGVGDAMTVTAPNGKTTTINLDPLLSKWEVLESDKLKKFIYDNKPNYEGLDKVATQQNAYKKTFNTQKEIDNTNQRFNNEIKSFEYEVQQLGLLKKGTPEYTKKANELVAQQNKLKENQQELKRSVGEYVGMKSEQGTYLGFLRNQLIEGVTEGVSGLTGIAMDVATGSLPDAVQKELKGKVIPTIRESLDYFKDDTTKEYGQDLNFVGGAIGGLVKSLPAMLAGDGLPYVMAGQISDGLDQEMSTNPDFKNISEQEKLILKTPMIIGGAVLEKYGFRNVIESKGLLNDVVLKAIGQSTKNTTTKGFQELIEQDVKNRFAKGLLKVGAGGLAEFETGASQELLDVTTKDVYNGVKGKKMFETPESFGELGKQVIKAGLQEAIGGLILSAPSAINTAFKEQDFTKVDNVNIDILKEAGNDATIGQMIDTDLKMKVNSGEITPQEAQDQNNNFRETVGLINSFDTEGLTPEQIKLALPIVEKIKAEENRKEGKLPIQKQIIQARIDELNQDLLTVTGQGAILETKEKSSQPTVDKLVGKNVKYNGKEGVITKDEGGKLTFENDNTVIELNGNETATEINLPTTESKTETKAQSVEVKGNNVKIGDEQFEFIQTNTDNNGKVVSVTLRTQDGKTITKRDEDLALDIGIAKNNDILNNAEMSTEQITESEATVNNEFVANYGQTVNDILESMPDEVLDIVTAMDNNILTIEADQLQEMALRSSEWADSAIEKINNSNSSETEKKKAVSMINKFNKDLEIYYGKIEQKKQGKANINEQGGKAKNAEPNKPKLQTKPPKAEINPNEVKQKPKTKKPSVLENTRKKYNKLDKLTSRTLLLRFFATGGKVSVKEAIDRTALGMKDLIGKVAKVGSTYHSLYESITDELGLEMGDIDQNDFDNMVNEFLRGNKADIFKEINLHIGEKEQDIDDPTNWTYNELLAVVGNEYFPNREWVIERIGEIESALQDELTPKEAEELDKNIEKYTVDGVIDWDAIANDKEVQQLNKITNERQNPETESVAKRDSSPISAKENVGEQKNQPKTTSKEIIAEINSKPLTHAVGVDMGQNEMEGTFISTEDTNRYSENAEKVVSVTVDIKNPYELEGADELIELQNNALAQAKENFVEEIPEFADSPEFNEAKTLDDDGLTNAYLMGFGDFLAAEATKQLKAQGYDSVYLRESKYDEGMLVVFDRKNVTFGDSIKNNIANESNSAYKLTKNNGVPFLSESGNDDYPTKGKVQQKENNSQGYSRSIIGVWNKTKNLQFTGTTKVKNAEDVAHIMRLLENKSVEHGFAVHVDAKGNSHIQYLSVGGTTGTVIDPKLVLAGLAKFKSKKIYLVHNHPSGSLAPSKPDISITKTIQSALGKLKIDLEHVIMDTYSNKYVLLDKEADFTVEDRNKNLNDNSNLTVYTFDEQKVINVPETKITTSRSAAEFIQQLRFTAMPKNAMLLLNQGNEIIGNYVFKDKVTYKESIEFIGNSGIGVSVIFYGNQQRESDARNVSQFLNEMNVKVLDHIVTDSNGKDIAGYYKSLADEGMLEETQVEYSTNSVENNQSNSLFPSVIKDTNIAIKQQGIKGKLLNEQEAKDLKKEIVSKRAPKGKIIFGQGYVDDNKVFREAQDIRQDMFNYDYPYASKEINGIDVRIAGGLLRKDKDGKKYKTYLLYADGKIVGEFNSVADAKSVVGFIEANLVKELPTTKEQAKQRLEDAKAAFIKKSKNLQLGGLETLPEFAELVAAYINMGYVTSKEIIQKFREDFEGYTFDEKIATDRINEILAKEDSGASKDDGTTKIYHGADEDFTIEGKKNRVMFAAKNKDYAKYYAKQRGGKVFEFDILNSKIAKEEYVKNKIKSLGLKTEDGNLVEIEDNLHRLIDPRFEDTSISKEGLNTLFSELQNEGYYGITFMDENQDLGGKNEIESIAIFNPKELVKSDIGQSKERPKSEPSEDSDQVKKKVATERAFEGSVRNEIKKYIEQKGLYRDKFSFEQRSVQADELISNIGVENAIEGVRNGEIRGALATAILTKAIKQNDTKMSKLKATDVEQLDVLGEQAAELITLLEQESYYGGESTGYLAYAYANDDIGYNVDVKISEYKANNNGEISPEMEAKFREINAEIVELNRKLAEAEARAKKAEEDSLMAAIIESSERETKKASTKIRKGTDYIVQKLREGKTNRPSMFMSSTPASLVWDGALETVASTIQLTGRGAEAIAKGVEYIKNSDWYKSLTDVGKKLAEDQYNKYFKETKKPTIVDDVVKVPSSLVRELVAQGFDNIDDMVTEVKAIMQEEYPDVTSRQIRDAITDYGKTKEQNKDDIAAIIRKLKRVGRIVSGLEDVNNKKRPLRSGLQRDTLEADERAMMKELREAMKDLPIDLDLEAEQQKTATDAAKTRLRNQIEDLQREIDKKEQVKRNVRTVKDDQELIDLKVQRDAKKAEHEAIFKDEAYQQERRLELTKKAAERRIEELRRRIKDGDFSKKVKKPIIADTELTKLRANKIRLQGEYDKEIYKAKILNRTQAQKWKDGIWDAWGLLRLLQATFEFSFVGIQGLIYATSHPIQAAKAFKVAMKTMFSESKTEQWLNEIKAQEYYPMVKGSKLAFSEPNAEITAREELFFSDSATILWDILGYGFKLLGKSAYQKWVNINPFKAFERASIGYLDTVRLQRFLDGVEMLKAKEIHFDQNPEAYKQMADVVNTFTGRASLGIAKPIAPQLTKIFFSPRNWASQIKTATPYAFYHFGKMRAGADGFKPTVQQKMAIMDFSKFVGLTTSMVILAATYLSGDDDDETGVETDPRSSDFGKIKIGNTRIDPWGGKIQQIILLSKLLSGEVKKNGEIIPLGVPYKTPTRLELIGQMASNKLAPSASLIKEYLSTRTNSDGETVTSYGKPYNFKDEFVSKLQPIYFSTIREVLKDDPTALDGLLLFYAYFGGSINTYKENKSKSGLPKIPKIPEMPKYIK